MTRPEYRGWSPRPSHYPPPPQPAVLVDPLGVHRLPIEKRRSGAGFRFGGGGAWTPKGATRPSIGGGKLVLNEGLSGRFSAGGPWTPTGVNY